MRITVKMESCCCGTNLRSGTIIIGIIDLIGALVTIIITSIAAANSNYYYWWDGYFWREHMNDLVPMYITMAVISGLLLVFDIMLIIGVSRSKPRLILPWIYYAYVSLLANFICAMIYGIYSFSYSYGSYGYLGILWSFCYLGVKIYFLMVVWSHYCQLLGGLGTNHNNGVHVTTYPTVPIGQQPLQNAQQPFPNPQQLYLNPQKPFPNPQQPYPNPQQPFPNPQQPYPNPQQPFPNPQSLPSMESMKRDM